MKDSIYIKGAREHNLKNIDVEIPRNKLVVFTGLSGSGKSSLAFDTLFAEGQRRYIESLSAYARQFIGQMDKPDVDYIEGLSPAISIDQKTTSKNPRSTVGTVTEIYDYIRLLYARIGVPHCPKCKREITETTVDQICDSILSHDGANAIILAPVVRDRKGEYHKQIEGYKKQGFLRIRIDGINYTMDEELPVLDKQLKHSISVVVDRLKIKDGIRRRLTDSLEIALKLAEGQVSVELNGEEYRYNTQYTCPDCEISLPELSPRLFSFNSPYGACPKCNGLGFSEEVDVDKVIPDWTKSLSENPINSKGLAFDTKMVGAQFKSLAKHYGFSLKTPLKDLPKKVIDVLLYGSGEKLEMDYDGYGFKGTMTSRFGGVINMIRRRYESTESELMKREYQALMKELPCDLCHQKRLNPNALSVTVGGKNIYEISQFSIGDLLLFFDSLKLSEREEIIANQILKEIRSRLNFLLNVGLNYLTLFRPSGSLSGGESQRIRLATQIGSGLVGVLYILDEPSIGLHQRDNGRLISTLLRLRDLGNTLIVVEHDEETMRSADYIVDIGPGAGVLGGDLVACGSVEDICREPRSITGRYLSGEKYIAIPKVRRQCDKGFLTVKGACQNNLKNINVDFPIGVLTAVTGVSGSGKSSLINGVLYPYLSQQLNGSRSQIQGKCKEIVGVENFDKVISIDQSPIGRTPRSNPATYTECFTDVRNLFAKCPDAIERGYNSGRFSFNIPGGRCEHCKGDGIIKIEMNFLSDVYVPCEVCKGHRYNHETLEVRYKGKNIFDVLDMTVEEACEFFRNIPRIYNKIKTLYDVGLGYIKLGQPATTLSGGEAQRVKLATELSKRSTGKTIYILDEPTTGLHTADVEKLLSILNRLVENGNTVIVIEHNLDVIKMADYIIDMGPEGGDAGGRVIAKGTPEEVANTQGSATGEYLKIEIEKDKKRIL